ncbi:MAG TPA: hypothetical protein VMZ32_00110 [Gammaproteobacteria bacterium]|nr:hypothetical protein [Gammaproteobacteria bacterium]
MCNLRAESNGIEGGLVSRTIFVQLPYEAQIESSFTLTCFLFADGCANRSNDRRSHEVSIISLTVFLLALSTTGQAMTYDFAAEGNRHEAGYSEFNSGDHSVILHGGTPDLPGGLTITASNGHQR